MKKIIKYLNLVILFCMVPASAYFYQEENYEKLTIEINQENLFIPASLDGIRLLHNDEGFTVVNDTEKFAVKTECIDKELRGLSNEKLYFLLGVKAKVKLYDEDLVLTKMSNKETSNLITGINDDQDIIRLSDEDVKEVISQLPPSSYIQIFQYSDGEYGLHLKTRLSGGGFWGATIGCWVGKFVASFVCHGAIIAVSATVSAFATPAVGAAVAIALEKTLGAAIETTTTAAAIAGGVTLAVVTGPI